MNKNNIEVLITTSISIIVLLNRLLFSLTSMNHYIVLILCTLVLINIQFYLRSKGFIIDHLWLIPLALIVQGILRFISIDLAFFASLSMLILTIVHSVPGLLDDLRGLKLDYLVYAGTIGIALSLHLDLGPIPYIVLAPLWEYLFLRSLSHRVSNCVPILNYIARSLATAILYDFSLIAIIYSVGASLLKATHKRASEVITLDILGRIVLLWVIKRWSLG